MRAIWIRLTDERGAVLVLALFTMAFLMVAGAFLLRMSSAETDIAYNTVWSEGAFYAAEAGVHMGVDGIGPTTVNPLPVTDPQTPLPGTSYSYVTTRTFTGTSTQPGYSIGSGTGYNPAGYVFHTHTINGAGNGPRNALRRIEARALYGPLAQ